MTKQINVQKATPTELYAKKAPYSSVSNDVVAMIVNPDALAIWIYLQTRSSDWKVIASYLQERFSIGRDRYWKAMSCLKELGLLSYETLREEGSGKMLGKRIIVHYEPTLPKTVDSGNRSDGDPSIRETDHYSIKDSSTESSDVKPTVAEAPSGAPRKSSKFDPVSAKPENVSVEAWADWCQHRKEIRKPLTAKTCEQQAKVLSAHASPDAVINLSISNGWTGLFPEKAPTVIGHQQIQNKHTGFDQRDYNAGLVPREGGGYAF